MNTDNLDTTQPIKCHRIINDTKLERGDVVATALTFNNETCEFNFVGPEEIYIRKDGIAFALLPPYERPDQVLLYYIYSKDPNAISSNRYLATCLNYFKPCEVEVLEAFPAFRQSIEESRQPSKKFIFEDSDSICNVKQWDLPEPYGRIIQDKLDRLEIEC